MTYPPKTKKRPFIFPSPVCRLLVAQSTASDKQVRDMSICLSGARRPKRGYTDALLNRIAELDPVMKHEIKTRQGSI